jgi:hypothetical protein
MAGNPESSSDRARSRSEWIELLDRRQRGSTPRQTLGKTVISANLARYLDADLVGNPAIRQEFVANVMAPAARALLSADGAWYQVALPDRVGSKYQTCRVVRVAVGLFQATQPGSMHRVTAYHVDPWNRAFLTVDEDGLFAQHQGNLSPWDGRSPAAKLPFAQRLAGAFDEISKWASSNLPTLAEGRALAQWHASEVEELKRLYDFFYPSAGNLAQIRKNAQTGYFAGKSGYIEKVGEQLRRMIPVYRTFLLSVGEIRASPPIEYKKTDGTAFTLRC